MALSVILKTLKRSETGDGVATELKYELDIAREICASYSASSTEQMMSRVFSNIAKLLRPDGPLGCHHEIFYAMSEWFDLLAAEDDNDIPPGPMVEYLVALDLLHQDMTGPIHAFCRRLPMRSDILRALYGNIRPKTFRKMRLLWKDHHNKHGLIRQSSSEHLISGRRLFPQELLDQYYADPDSILVNVGPRRRKYARHFDYDNGFSSASDISDDDDDFCRYRQRQLAGYDYSFHPAPHGHPYDIIHPLDRAALLAPPRGPSPLLLEDVRRLTFAARPGLGPRCLSAPMHAGVI
ncbi:MAG: hypothetical protein Q9166_007599 [cf. Caloplaca sp. 2 TL-2023]